MSKAEIVTTEKLDQLVDEGKADVLQYFDLENARRGESKRINIDLPVEFLAALDREATRRGITRQSLIKVWLYDCLTAHSKVSSFAVARLALALAKLQGPAELRNALEFDTEELIAALAVLIRNADLAAHTGGRSVSDKK